MVSSYCEPTEGAEELVSLVQNFGEGGSGPHNARLLITDSVPGSPDIWRVYVGGDLADWTSPGGISPQGDNKADGDATSDMDRKELVLPSPLDGAMQESGLDKMDN